MIENNEVYWPATPHQPQPEKGDISPAKVIEVLQGILAPEGDTEADGSEVERGSQDETPEPLEWYVEGDLR